MGGYEAKATLPPPTPALRHKWGGRRLDRRVHALAAVFERLLNRITPP